MHAQQDGGQVLPGASGNSETLAASGVLSLEAGSADSQISSPLARKFLPALDCVPGDGDPVHRSITLRGKNAQKRLFLDIWKRFPHSYLTTD